MRRQAIPAPPEGFVEIVSDTYISPPVVTDFLGAAYGSVDVELFSDPATRVPAKERWDIRDGKPSFEYTDLVPPQRCEGRSHYANCPYSGSYPAKMAIVFAELVRRHAEILLLQPAAFGSEYWQDWIWPFANFVVPLGRLSYVAGRDIRYPKGHELEGKIQYRKGTLVHGNRNDVALVHGGPNAERLERLARRHFKRHIIRVS